MKLLDLHLRAYGPFTDRHLDLSAGHEGLHIVFGLNEAGKSSSLRALKGLLHGIPRQTPDNFLHDYSLLRVGGRFRDREGREWVFYRRKGNRDTLLDERDQPLPDDSLARLLGGVDERLFERLFAIDYPGLVEGGQALLAEQGQEGAALFSGGLGGVSIRPLLDELDKDARDLFAPRASKPEVNATLGQLRDLQSRLQRISLPARDWDAARVELERARQLFEEQDARLAEATARRRVLERIRRSQRGLAKRADARARLATLGDGPLLPEDFGQRRVAADNRRWLAQEAMVKAGARLANLRAAAAGFVISEPLLAAGEVIDGLREQLGSHRKAARDRPALVAKAAAQEEQARQRLAAIRPDLPLAEVERLRPLLGRGRRAADLGARPEASDTRVRLASATLAETEQALAAKGAELRGLPVAPPLDLLRQAVDQARRLGEMDVEIDREATHLGRHEAACARELSALGLWRGDLAALRQAPLPGAESLRRFAAEFQALEDERRRLEGERAEADAGRRRAQTELRALQLAGEVPSEADLDQARAHRDRGWQLVRRNWLEGADITAEARRYGQGTALPEAFEGALGRADDLADRLRREAQRVHEQAAAQARLESCEQALNALGGALETLAERREALDGRWRAVWTPWGLAPLSPGEMLEWLTSVNRLRELAEAGDERRERLRTLTSNRAAARRTLLQALAPLGETDSTLTLGESLAPLLSHADHRLQAGQALRDRHRALREILADLETRRSRLEGELANARADRDQWLATWTALMNELGLPPRASPAEVSDYLQAVADSLKLAEEARGFRERVAGIDADAHRFAVSVADRLDRVAPDLAGLPVEEAVTQLHQRLARQRDDRSRLDELSIQMDQTEREIQAAEADRLAADQTLAELCRQAGCDEPGQLPVLEARAQARRQLEQDLRAIERELIENGDGLTLEALALEAGAADLDTVLRELEALERCIEVDWAPGRDQARERALEAERALAAMTGGDAAAALAEEGERLRAGLRAQVERYVRVRLAGRVLRDAMERFRRQYRDPLLGHASDSFARLTRGAFAAVESDFDEADRPVLVGVRPGGQRLRVEAMSTGTRDQLYLALRLANLNHHLEHNEPLPFIVDDILIQFDDQRTRATLDLLADLSDRLQVILFTHHGGLVDQARALPGAEGRVIVHELD